MSRLREADLYPPIKAYLEGQGYEVKSEVGPADIVAVRPGDPPVIVEMKTGFSLSLLQQGVARLSISEVVYLAVPRPAGRRGGGALKANVKICRRLGLGVLTVRPRDGAIDILCDPAPYSPRQSKLKRERLLGEFQRRSGDPNTGGTNRTLLVTAYRQDALRLATFLADHGAQRGRDVARETGVPTATRIMADNHYGWFERVSVGVYTLTDAGHAGLARFGRLGPNTAPAFTESQKLG